ncbi:MAG: DUF2029 domain-containing protein [Candidatus Dormibacteraeota bacterium]|nr:DUF2029 domain-containing protein [Candidatus Dormibacteraeota bacterium]
MRHAWVAAGAVTAAVITVVLRIWPGHFVDLAVYRLAARAVLDETRRPEQLYSLRSGALRLPFTYPPFAVLPMLPLAYGKWVVDKLIARVLLALALAALWHASLRSVGRRVGWPLLAVLTAASLVLEPVIHNFWTGQLSLVVVLLVVVDLPGVMPERYRGVLTGIAAALKLTPLVFVVLLALTRQWHALARMLGAFVAAAAVGFVVFPAESSAYWTSYVQRFSRVGSPWSLDDQSVRGTLARLGLGQHGADGTLTLLAAVVVTAGAAVLLGALWWRRGERLLAVSLAGLASLLASPISWVHHWCWIIPLLVALTRLSYVAVGLVTIPYCVTLQISNHLLWRHTVHHWGAAQNLVGNGYVWAALLVVAYAGWRLLRGCSPRSAPPSGAPAVPTTLTP